MTDSPEGKQSNINPQLDLESVMSELSRFVTSKLAAGLSPQTITWYEWIVGRYIEWCSVNAVQPREADSIEMFLASLRRRGLAASTVDAHYRALRVFFSWLTGRKFLQENPMDVLEPPRVPKQRPKHVSKREFDQLYESISDDKWVDARDKALLLIMFYSGLRVGELLSLRLEDIDTARHILIVNAGKGGHARFVPHTPALVPVLDEYIYIRPTFDGVALWLSDNGYGGIRGKLTAEGVRQMLRRRCNALGIRVLNPHAFRHGFAMSLLNAGMDMSAISAAMGHTSIKTTESTYAHWLTGGLKREYEQALRRLTRNDP